MGAARADGRRKTTRESALHLKKYSAEFTPNKVLLRQSSSSPQKSPEIKGDMRAARERGARRGKKKARELIGWSQLSSNDVASQQLAELPSGQES